MSKQTRFGVQYQLLSQTIEAGRLNKAQNMFLDKHDVTNQVLGAIAEMTLHEHDGAAVYILGDKLEIIVEARRLEGTDHE